MGKMRALLSEDVSTALGHAQRFCRSVCAPLESSMSTTSSSPASLASISAVRAWKAGVKGLDVRAVLLPLHLWSGSALRERERMSERERERESKQERERERLSLC